MEISRESSFLDLLREGTEHDAPWHERVATFQCVDEQGPFADAWRAAVDPRRRGLFEARVARLVKLGTSPATASPGDLQADFTWLDVASVAGDWGPDTTKPSPSPSVVWAALADQAWSETVRRSLDASWVAPAAEASFKYGLVVRLRDAVADGTGDESSPADAAQDDLALALIRRPVLRSLLRRILNNWISGTAEVLRRVHSDRLELETKYGIGADEVLLHVRAGVSDPHAGGRTVHVLEFSSGTAVVYKPKPLLLEALLAEAQEAAGLSAGASATGIDVLDKGRYGYSNFVHRRLPEKGELQAFYTSVGQLLAVLYLLGVSDTHFENVIPAGQKLVLIDAETAFETPMTAVVDRPSAYDPLRASVLSVDLLPCWVSFDGSSPVDVSGLSSLQSLRHTTDAPPTYNSQTAATDEEVEAHADAWRKVHAENSTAVADGFAQTYRRAMEPQTQRRLRAIMLRARLAPRRVVVRPSRTYAAIQTNALSSSATRTWATRALRLDQLARAFGTSHDLGAERLLLAEIEALEQLDIPRFEQLAGDTSLWFDGRQIMPEAFERSGVDLAVDRLESLTELDLAWQVALIRASLTAGMYDEQAIGEVGTRSSRPLLPGALKDELMQARLPTADGEATWLTMTVSADGRRAFPTLAGEGLYEGRLGIAAYLIGTGHLEDGLDVLSSSLRGLSASTDEDLGTPGLALGLSGLGGMLRAVRFIAQYSCDTRIQTAQALLLQILDRSDLQRDTALDLVGGIAGLSAPLAALLRDGEGSVYKHLKAVGDRLLETRDSTTGGWALPWTSRPLAGLAHGASGFAVALAEVASQIPEEAYLNALAHAIRFEDSLQADGFWPDLRPKWRRSAARY